MQFWQVMSKSFCRHPSRHCASPIAHAQKHVKNALQSVEAHEKDEEQCWVAQLLHEAFAGMPLALGVVPMGQDGPENGNALLLPDPLPLLLLLLHEATPPTAMAVAHTIVRAFILTSHFDARRRGASIHIHRPWI